MAIKSSQDGFIMYNLDSILDLKPVYNLYMHYNVM